MQPEVAQTQAQSGAPHLVWSDKSYIDRTGRPSPDGHYFAHQGSGGNLSLRNLVTGEERLLTHDATARDYASYGIFSPDGSQIAYQWGITSLRQTSAKGTGSRVVYSSGEGQSVIPGAYTPDGKQIVVTLAANSASKLVLISAEGGTMRTLKMGTAFRAGDFSPDGRYLVYSGADDKGNIGIFTLSISAGNEAAVVTDAGRVFESPFWTPDGNAVAYISDRSGTPALWMAPVRDGRPDGSPTFVRQMPEGTGRGVTRDGSYVYYVRNVQDDVFIADFDSSNLKISRPRRLTDRSAGKNLGTEWSPDGKLIAYLQRENGGSASLVVHPVASGNGRVLERVARPNFQDGFPRWFPDSRSVLIPDIVDRRLAFRQIPIESSPQRIAFTPNSGGIGTGVRIARDGKAIFYSASDPNHRTLLRLIKRDLVTGSDRELYQMESGGYSFFGLDLSADGQRLAFLANLNTGEQKRVIVMVPADGGPARELYRGSWSNPLPRTLAWTRDGRFLLFAAAVGDSEEIMALPTNGGDPVRTGLLGSGISSISLSPDGRAIVYSASSHEDQLWVMDKLLPSARANGVQRSLQVPPR